MSINNLATRIKSLKNFRLSYSVKREFSQKTTWWFTSVASVVGVITILGVAAASGYEPIPSFSRSFNITSPLWYEVLLGNATSSLGLSASRVCSGSVIELGNEFVTTNGFMDYQLIYYIDNRTTLEKANDGLLYADESLQDCSVLMLNLFNFNSARTTSIQGQAMVACNTSAGPFFIATTRHPSWNPLNLPQFNSLLTPDCSQSLNSTDSPVSKCAMQYWWYVIYYLSSLANIPTHFGSQVMNGLAQRNVSSLRIFYNVTDTPEPNTPANDQWHLCLGYSSETDLDENILNIYYSTDGSVDLTRTSTTDFALANNLIQPLLTILQSRSNSSINIWTLLNSLFLGYYWFLLFDLGHASPQIYSNSAARYLVPDNFSQPISYPTTNNIILNSSLADLIFHRNPVLTNPSPVGEYKFVPSGEMRQVLDAITRFNGSVSGDSRIRRIYLCTERMRKQVMDLLVSVFGQGFGLIAAGLAVAYFLLILFLGVDDKLGEETRTMIAMEEGKLD